jgi:hypothetical protein
MRPKRQNKSRSNVDPRFCLRFAEDRPQDELPEDEKRESWFTDLRPYPGLTVEEAKKNRAPSGANYYQDTPGYETCAA